VKKARPEGSPKGFLCGQKLNTQSKKLLISNNLYQGVIMYKRLYFVHCEDCHLEYNSENVNVLNVTHSPFGIKIAEFVCTNCNETVQSLITEV